ncbi:TorF family putative porin [Acinetobacter thermotolerans]|uniref:TorF family putative porin n=2 Tax=Acinetobacter thermotolerans TaxID=3151487 RepID=UPI00325C33DD
MSQLPKFSLLLLFATMASVAGAQDASTFANGEVSASVGVVNKYIYRGGEENDNPAVQLGVEYAHNSGVFAGYWGSTLNYDPSDESQNHGFEHDFYIGYGHELNENWSYKSQLISYYYQDGGTIYSEDGLDERRTTGFELLNDVSYKNLTMGLGVMLADASYANAGDVYLSAAYSYPLPKDFSLNTSIGASIYNDSHDDQLLNTTESVAFNEARIGFSKTLAEKIDVSLDYVYGGEDREGSDLDDHVVVGVNYNF